MRLSSPWLLSLLACLMFQTMANAQDATKTTPPVVGIRNHRPSVHALTNARLVVSPSKTIENGTLLIENGLIKSIGEAVTVPADAKVWDLKDKVVYAGFIDAYTAENLDLSKVSLGAPYWNSNITPQALMFQSYQNDTSLNKSLRGQGITTRLVAPTGGVISGISTLVTTGDGASNQVILKDRVAQHIALTPSRDGRQEFYPTSPMGAVALARQSMLDAQWYRLAWGVSNSTPNITRPERNDALETLQYYPQGRRLVIIEAFDEQYAGRADDFSREFSLNTILRSHGHEYKRLELVKGYGRPLIVPVNFPKAPNVSTPEAAANASLEQLMHWELAPENPARLASAGLKIAFTSEGLSDKEKFLSGIRKAVDRGLSKVDALAALTTTPAKLYGVQRSLGTLEVGKNASFVVTDGELFSSKTKVISTWVDGKHYPVQEEAPFNPNGSWKATFDGEHSDVFFVIDGTYKNPKLTFTKVEKGKETEIKLEHLNLKDYRIAGTFTGDFPNGSGVSQLSGLFTHDDQGELILTCSIHWPDGEVTHFVANRTEKTTPKENDEKEDTKANTTSTTSVSVNYPLGAYGRPSEIFSSEPVLFRNGTIWTCGSAGILKNSDLLVVDGKIVAIGTDLARSAPEGVVIIDATGKHITPGMIDCHTHIASDGGINEVGQAVTAEVRIADFIDATDIAMYRQIAGGTTSASVLHGSANPIGGQNQVIKFRWGQGYEAMKMAEAPQGIKFALGENVKQSRNPAGTRYPRTRMGVDELIRDNFEAAKAYDKRWKEWHKNHQGLPPRIDLELQALVEILKHDRWIHCHSYRQSEILALLRTLEENNITIGSLQHILEGYKVADAMKQHGAMGSSFSDWWAYKFEVYDAIPHNGAIMHHVGVVVSFNSDDAELGRRLNTEAAKAVKYGNVSPEEALKFVTINPAKQLRIDQYVGSLETGKQADIVLWSGDPLSTMTRCEQTWIDGNKYFDVVEEKKLRKENRQLREHLIQKILVSGEPMLKKGEKTAAEKDRWFREDIFCGFNGHGFGHKGNLKLLHQNQLNR
ncbi:MAG: amidohydrolase family protein [Pirellulaceae bacterium]|nr:amidohydrolase family protein [Pirellulaceae bacterium]